LESVFENYFLCGFKPFSWSLAVLGRFLLQERFILERFVAKIFGGAGAGGWESFVRPGHPSFTSHSIPPCAIKLFPPAHHHSTISFLFLSALYT
jgi:hypothetical protein